MKEALEFVGKVLKHDDAENNCIYFDSTSVKCSNGKVVSSHPYDFPITDFRNFSVEGKAVSNAFKICNYLPYVRMTKKTLVIEDTESNFSAPLKVKDWSSLVIIKKALKKKTTLPEDFKEKVKSMLAFTARESEHMYAMSLIVDREYMYCTNNISVVRCKQVKRNAIRPCIIARELLNVMLKIKEAPVSIATTKKMTVILYESGAWISCQAVTDSAPNLGAIFDVFKKPKQISDKDKQALLAAISMSSDGEIKIKKGTIQSDNCSIEGSDLDTCTLEADTLEDLLKMFDKVTFNREYSFFRNDNFDAIMVGRA